ncbi:uncharacterized protein LOC135828082 [Sycon ciliatum]|uniref:uncharacterized protein LOC135828082 n=1 Tax=Sycon ciliatum TaxID=27933 RepID=UPI0031F6196C
MCADVPPSGRYIYMDAAGRRQGDTAVISLAKVPGLRGPGCALSFWYNMYLDSAGTLEVTLRGTSTLIWTATGFLGNFWQQIFVPINDQTDFGITFTGTVGSSSIGYIALDDIKLSADCCTTPVMALRVKYVLSSTSIAVHFLATASRYCVRGNASSNQLLCSPNSTVTITGLNPYTVYSVSAHTETSSLRSQSTAEVTLRTNASAPTSAPAGLTIYSKVTSVDLVWVQVKDFNGEALRYDIFYEEVGAARVYTISVPSLVSSTTVNGLKFDTNYTFSVAAVSSGGRGPNISRYARTTQDRALAPNITSMKILATTVTINLRSVPGNYHLSKFCCYFTRRSVSGIPMSNLATERVCSETSPVVLSPVEEDAAYGPPLHYCIARNTLDNTDGHTARMAGFNTPPAAPSVVPSDLTLDSTTATTVTFSWTAVDPFKLNGRLVAYHVSCHYLNGMAVTSVKTNNTQVSIGELTFATKYDVSVTAESTGGLRASGSYLQVLTSQEGTF